MLLAWLTKLIPLQSQHLTTLQKEHFENSMGKGENAVILDFLFFQQHFLYSQEQYFNFLVTFILLSANTLNLDQSKILSFDKKS